MEPFVLGAVFCGIIGFAGWAASRFRREFAGNWRGREVRICWTLGRGRISVDGRVIAEKKKWSWTEISETYDDPLHGACPVQFLLIRDSNGSISDGQLVIDGEIVHLIQAPTDWMGRSISEKMPRLKEVSTVEGMTITDPRYAAASRLFETIRTEVAGEVASTELVASLYEELSRNILIAQRLIQSKADYAALGNDAGQMDHAQQTTESRIEKLLTALQDVHLAVVQRNLSEAGPNLDQVRDLIAQIHAETELEQSLAASNQKVSEPEAEVEEAPKNEATRKNRVADAARVPQKA